jgi:hypothetical protein
MKLNAYGGRASDRPITLVQSAIARAVWQEHDENLAVKRNKCSQPGIFCGVCGSFPQKPAQKRLASLVSDAAWD